MSLSSFASFRPTRLLNGITMYKVMTIGLTLLVGLALAMSFFGSLSFSIGSLLTSLGVLSVAALVVNETLARTFRVPPNFESWFITTLILFFILPPVSDLASGIFAAAAAAIAIASKFLIAYRRAQVFNPAALGVFAVATLGLLPTIWWVGAPQLTLAVAVLGLLVLLKLRQIYLFAAFAAASIAVTALGSLLAGRDALNGLELLITASPFLFLGTIMLTEPSTMPSSKRHQAIFAVLVGVLFAGNFKFGPLFILPETALLIGNVYAAAVSRRRTYRLKLKGVDRHAGRLATYRFTSDEPVHFAAGQYMEWTLPGVKPDLRGNRRTFTIASSPSEKEVLLSVKFYQPSSTFKQRLKALQPGDTLLAGNVTGSFTLPTNEKEKLLFIAGGIGITPFRSMVQSLNDEAAQRDIVLIYAVSSKEEVMYKEVFDQAASRGLRMHVFASDEGQKLTVKELQETVPDIQDRLVYISGPNAMVDSLKRTIRSLGVLNGNIKTDHFTGY